jgi:hypothetical protein
MPAKASLDSFVQGDIGKGMNLDVVLICRDSLRVRVERVVCTSGVELGDVDIHSTVIAPVVGECNDESQAVRLGGRNYVVKFAQTVCTGVDGRDTVCPELIVCTEVLDSGKVYLELRNMDTRKSGRSNSRSDIIETLRYVLG